RIDANGQRTDYEYDAAGRLIRTILPPALDARTNQVVRAEIRQEYDAADRRTAVIDANGQRTTFDYDPAGRLTVPHFADGTPTRRRSGPHGELTAQIAQAGAVTTYSYDAVADLLAVTEPAATPGGAPRVTSYTYDEVGNRLTQTDALGHTKQLVYDA